MTPLGREWVRKAENDRRTVLQLQRGRARVHEAICFHCQQLAEKYLKALLHEAGQPVPKTHNCSDLVALLLPFHSEVEGVHETASGLTRYAVQYRYPGFHADARMARSAWSAAERIRTEIRRRLGLRPLP
jgi:HEPN domain-containing protein